MRIVAFLTEAAVIDPVLRHLEAIELRRSSQLNLPIEREIHLLLRSGEASDFGPELDRAIRMLEQELADPEQEDGPSDTETAEAIGAALREARLRASAGRTPACLRRGRCDDRQGSTARWRPACSVSPP